MSISIEELKIKLQRTKDSLLTFFNSSTNTYNKHPNRVLNLYIQDVVDKKSPQPEYNAYSLYRDNEDLIFITTGLLNLIIKLFDGYSGNQERDFWMIQVASEFSLHHEFGHLYSGHCQLKKNTLLPMIGNGHEGFTNFDWQTLEVEADMFSSSRCVDRIIGKIIQASDEVKTIWGNKDAFFNDSNVAIAGVMFIMRHLEESYSHKAYYLKNHPPSLTRFIRTVGNMITYANSNPRLSGYGYNFDTSHSVVTDIGFAKRLGISRLNDYELLADEPNYTTVENYLDHNFNDLMNKLENLRRLPFPSVLDE